MLERRLYDAAMETIPEPKSDDGTAHSRRPAAVTAAGWVMLVGSILGGIASAAAIVVLTRDVMTGAIGLWHYDFPEHLIHFAAAVVGCLLVPGVWRGARSARRWTFCVGGTIATVAMVHACYDLVFAVMFLTRGDAGNSLSYLALVGLNLVTCAVAAVPVLLLVKGPAAAWFPPGRPAPVPQAAVPLLVVAAVATVTPPLISGVAHLIEIVGPSRNLSAFFPNLLVVIVVPMLVIGVAFAGRRSATPLAQAAAFAAFGYACFRGPRFFISGTVDGWFGDIGSIAYLLAYVVLLIVGIAGLRLLLRGDVPRLRPPMAPDPRR